MSGHYIQPQQYSDYLSGEGRFNYYNLNRAIYDCYYNLWIDRVRTYGYNGSFLNWFCDMFEEDFPASFVLHKKSDLVLNPPQGRRWLIFVHERNADVRMYLARYIVVGDGLVRLFGDGPIGLIVDTNGGGVRITGLAVPPGVTESAAQGDVRSL